MQSTADPTTEESEDSCVICLSTVTDRATTVPCKHHTFDFVCLVSWLQKRSTCPLCKTEVTAVQYEWRSPTDYKWYAVSRSHPPSNTPSGSANPATSLFAPYALPRRPRGARRPYSPPIVDEALQRRREVYQRKLYSLHVGSNSISGYRDITPQMFGSSPELQSRARTWIRRELRVFTFLRPSPASASASAPTTSSNAEFLLSYIISILKMIDVKASNAHAENLLTEFLGRDNSRLFLHELNAWLRSPYAKLQDWDLNVQYDLELD